MEYLYFALFVVFLVAMLVLLSRIEARAKRRQRKAAYDLLERPDPSEKEIRQTIRGLRLYEGHWRKDKEFSQLAARLKERLRSARS
jgi:ABC-type multidrug transport system fused ATPase/permease subunit